MLGSRAMQRCGLILPGCMHIHVPPCTCPTHLSPPPACSPAASDRSFAVMHLQRQE